MSQTSTVMVEDVTEKSGEKNGKKWTRYGLKDGNGDWYSTFEGGVITPSLKGQRVTIEWEPNGNFKNLLRVAPVEDSPIAARQEDGSADWDLIGLRKTRCALWVAALQSDSLEVALKRWVELQTTDIGTADIIKFAQGFAKQLVLGAELDIFQRPTAGADEDIPF